MHGNKKKSTRKVCAGRSLSPCERVRLDSGRTKLLPLLKEGKGNEYRIIFLSALTLYVKNFIVLAHSAVKLNSFFREKIRNPRL